MIFHTDLGSDGFARSRALYQLIVAGEIVLGGNKALKIYGRLSCPSGKRMKVQNRVFFKSADEADMQGYRPCGNCMPEEHKIWKHENAEKEKN